MFEPCDTGVIERATSDRRVLQVDYISQADMAELVDALDLGSSAARRGGSTPSIRTIAAFVEKCASHRPDASVLYQ